ncbi:MAG: LysM peptidoglycan-binding domain-containing M23 family metallopeptidase [Pseudomonadota bacterium]
MPDMKLSLIAPAAALLLVACDVSRKEPAAPIVYRGTQPGGAVAPEAAPLAQAPAPAYVGATLEERGITLYDGYETIRARDGDTIAAMAARAGLTPSELAAYNGLSTAYAPQSGDELVLPAREDRYQTPPEPVAVAAAPAPAASRPIEASPLPTNDPLAPPPAGEEVAAAPAPGGEGEVLAAAPHPGRDGSGWSAELARSAIDGSPAAAGPAPTPAPRAAGEAPAPAPQAAPAAETEVAAVAPAAPVGGGLFSPPAEAPIVRGYSQAPGPDRNDGVDFGTASGDPVVAAGDGTVALISKSLGGLGTIVLIRHPDQFLTVYGRVADVAVSKGDRVSRGQVIARVADVQAPRDPHLHFEIRKGAQSVDPATYF